MGCNACGQRKTIRIRDTTKQPAQPADKKPSNNSASSQGNTLRNKLRFTGR